jgi:hypothetical protein
MNIMKSIFAIALILSFNACAYYIVDPDWGSYSKGPRDRRLILDQETRKTGGRSYVGPYVEVGSGY